MKKNKRKIWFYLVVFIGLILFSLNVNAIWCAGNPDNPTHKPDITDGLVSDFGQSNNWSESPSIVVYENVPYIAYEGQILGANWSRIFFTYWNGTAWQEPIMVSNESGQDKAKNPILVINIVTGEMHLVWSTATSSARNVFYSRSDGFGDPWDSPISLDELNAVTKDNAAFPFIGLDSNGFVHAIFFYEKGGTREVYYTTNLDGGWSVPEKIGDSAQETGTGRVNPIYITVDRKAVPNVPDKPIPSHLSSKIEEEETIKFDVVPEDPCKYATCGNGSCEASCGETQSNCCGDCGNCAPDTIHILWKNKADEKIVHRQKDIAEGETWSAMDYVDSGKSSHPFSVADNDAGLHVVYESETIASNTEIYYKMLESGSWKTKPAGSPNISNTSDESVHPSVAVDKEATPKIVWSERQSVAPNKYQIYYLEWNSNTNLWEELGSNPIWVEPPPGVSNTGYPSVRLDFEGNPYVAWEQRLTAGGRGQIWMVYWSDDCSFRPGPNKPPVPLCKVTPTQGDLKTAFKFDAHYTVDDHTPQEELYVRWDWDESDGVNYDTGWTTNKIAYNVFNESKPHTITLQARDEQGKTKTDTCLIIDVAYGDILFLYDLKAEPIIVKPGETINFTASVLNLIDTDVHAILTFKLVDEEGNTIQTFPSINKVIPANITGNPMDAVKEFTQAYTVNLPKFKIYYIYAEVKVDPLDPLYDEHMESGKYLNNNNRRTIFSVIDLREVQVPEIDVIGIGLIVFSVLFILVRKNKN